MPKYTIETTYRLPVFRHKTIEAPSVEEACRLAIEDDDWENVRRDYESAGETFVTGIWQGADAAYRGTAELLPSQFTEAVQRKADHFDELLAVLRLPARKMGLSVVEFERWLPQALAAVAKAAAILGDRPDPEREICGEVPAVAAGRPEPNTARSRTYEGGGPAMNGQDDRC